MLITADYWKGIVRGVVCMIIATLMFTTQTSVVKWGSMIGYTAAVILIFRGLIQFICCFLEATINVHKATEQSRMCFSCNILHICKDLKSVGIVPRRTIIPIFHETTSLNQSRSNLLSQDYGSFQSTTSYSSLPPAGDESTSMLNLNMHTSSNVNLKSCVSPQLHLTVSTDASPEDRGTQTASIQVLERSQAATFTPPPEPIAAKKAAIPSAKRTRKQPRKTASYKCLIWSAIVLRGVFGGVGTLLLFQASILLPVGDMQSLMALTAAITPFLAFLVFRDTLTKLHLLSLVGAVVGVLLIVQPSFIFGSLNLKSTTTEDAAQMATGYVYAIAGSIVQALIYICIQFARKVPIYILTMSQSIMGIVTGVIVLACTRQLGDAQVLWIADWFDLAFVLILGFVGYVFLWLITMSGRYITSGVIALLLNLSIVWGYIIQILVFHEKPTWITIVGAVCMFAAAAVVSVDKISDAKRKSRSIAMSVVQRNITTTVGV